MTIRTPYAHIAAAGLLLLLSVGAYAFWFRHVNALSAEAAQLSTELRTRGDAGSRASSLRRAIGEIERQEGEVYRRFVGSDTIVTYLEGVEATAESLGASVEVVSVGNASAKRDQLVQLQMSLRITGTFDAVMRTLGAIEYQAYDTTLSSLTLDTPPQADAGWTAAATFLVGMPPAATTGTPAKPIP